MDLQSSRQRQSNALLLPLLLLLSAGLFSACAPDALPGRVVRPALPDPAAIPTIAIRAVDYGYIMSDRLTIHAGLIAFAMVNDGSEAHQAQVARLKPGVTPEQVTETMVTNKDQAAGFSLLTFVGGPDTISPGYGQEAILNLTAGQYVLLCFVVGQDQIPHLNKGMIHFFTVASEQGQLTPPPTDGTIIMKNNRYQLPSLMSQSRPLTIRIVNQDNEPHEMNIVKLNPGRTIHDIHFIFSGPLWPSSF